MHIAEPSLKEYMFRNLSEISSSDIYGLDSKIHGPEKKNIRSLKIYGLRLRLLAEKIRSSVENVRSLKFYGPRILEIIST